MLQSRLGRGSVFLDATDAIALHDILSESLARSEALVLLLTKSVLERPWVLMEVYMALRLKLPLLCVHVVGGGYDFASASHYLNNLEAELEQRDKGALGELRTQLEQRGQSLHDLQTTLAAAIPSVIAIPFDPGTGDEEHLMNGLSLELCERKAMLKLQSPGHRRLPTLRRLTSVTSGRKSASVAPTTSTTATSNTASK